MKRPPSQHRLLSLAIAALFAAALSGCAADPIVVRTVQVKVPVPVPCDAPAIERPVYALETVDEGADVYELARAALAEIEQREAREIRLEAALNSCRKLEKK